MNDVSQPTAMKCPSCASFLRADDFDAARGTLTCSYCKALMVFGGGDSSARSTPPARAEVPLPPSIKVAKRSRGLEIRRRWFHPLHVFLVFFCIAWNAFLVFWYTTAVGSGAPWIFKVFPIVHVAVGVGLTYFTLAGFLNTTTIAVERRELRVSHAPLPWRGAAKLESSSIDQLFCKQKLHRNKHGHSYTYEVWMSSRDSKSRKLVSGLPEPEQALFIEQQVERALGLPDRVMPGELAR